VATVRIQQRHRHRFRAQLGQNFAQQPFGNGTVRDDPQVNAFLAAQTALGRVGLPDDIGGVAAALLAPGSAWINAQRVEASGGMFL
jgi:NAD(P)-dependent dehydrogenase (short-subunit alcohol dehydrogenase family)